MATALDTTLTALAALEAAIVPTGGVTPIGSPNAYAQLPKPTASTPLDLPCVINLVRAWENKDEDQIQGRIVTQYLIEIYLFTFADDVEDAWVDAQPYITPMQKMLFQPGLNQVIGAITEVHGGSQGYYKYRDRTYYGLKFNFLADIHEML